VPDGIALGPGEGHQIHGGALNAVVKVAMSAPAFASTFEMLVPPGYDVGAHVHGDGAEIFYVVSGQLDVLAFEPVDRSVPDWHEWRSESGQAYLRGGPGSFLFVPPGVPHAFANPADEPATVFFQSSMSQGHEEYFEELADLLRRSPGRPPGAAVADIRRRYAIEQITDLHPGRG